MFIVLLLLPHLQMHVLFLQSRPEEKYNKMKHFITVLFYSNQKFERYFAFQIIITITCISMDFGESLLTYVTGLPGKASIATAENLVYI